jgi:hypothetical protein
MSRNPLSTPISLSISGNGCRLNRSMQHYSILLIRLRFSRRPDPLGRTQLNLNRAVFSLNQRSPTNLAVETSADWTSGRCCVDPLRPPRLSGFEEITSELQATPVCPVPRAVATRASIAFASLASRLQNSHDGDHCVPIPCRGGHTK